MIVVLHNHVREVDISALKFIFSPYLKPELGVHNHDSFKQSYYADKLGVTNLLWLKLLFSTTRP